jgi:hypothetical protein
MHRWSAALFVVWAIALVGTSTPRILGDGPEYVTMAEKLARFESPSMTVREARERGVTQLTVRANDRWHEFVHFWLYPALAVPLLWVGVPMLTAFTILNLLFLALLLWAATERLEWPGRVFVMAAPIWWWVDKPHAEVLTYSLLAAALIWLPFRPHWSLLALGVASAQNPPVAGLLVMCAAYAWRSGVVPARQWVTFGAVGLGIALLHPIYYLLRMGRPTVLAEGVAWPTLDLWGYVIWDANVGLLFGDPWPLAVVAVAFAALLGRRTREATSGLLWSEIVVSGAAAALFLLSFAQTANVNHGATPGMSRYALWLLPLTIPLWRIVERSPSRAIRGSAAGVALASMCWTMLFFRPARAEGHLHPSTAAQSIWTARPGLSNPLPEIFLERLHHLEGAPPPAATPGCEKALLIEGRWPAGCDGPSAPPPCTSRHALCYANREADGYAFVATTARGRSSWF